MQPGAPTLKHSKHTSTAHNTAQCENVKESSTIASILPEPGQPHLCYTRPADPIETSNDGQGGPNKCTRTQTQGMDHPTLPIR